MGVVIAFAVLLGVLPPVSVKESAPVVSKDENHFSQRFSRGKETLRVDVWRRPFRRERHQLKLDAGQLGTVDGRLPLGTDGGPPESLRTEIAKVGAHCARLGETVASSEIRDVGGDWT